MKYARIAGVHINIDQLGSFKSLKDLKTRSLPIFDHLSVEDQNTAFEELWSQGYAKPVENPLIHESGTEAANAALDSVIQE